MKILFILPEYYPHSGGGISTYYLHYIRALKSHCNRIKVIVGSGYVQSDECYNLEGVEIEYLKTEIYAKYFEKFSKFDLFAEFKKNIAAAWAMYEQADAGNNFDIIECTDFGLGFIPWIIKHDRPVITRLHGSTGQIHLHESSSLDNVSVDFVRQTELLLLPACDKLITHSLENQKFWNRTLADQSVIKIDPVFYPGTVEPLLQSERENYGLVTARIQQWKGPLQLCEAISKLDSGVIPRIRWLGRDMPYEGGQHMSEFLIHKFPSIWNQTIIPESPIANREVGALQQKAKFGVVASTWDMFNFTCLEFLSFGTPLICSDGAGCSDLIVHGENGLKYVATDTSALAECLRELIGMSEPQYNKIALGALETVSTRLSPEKLIPLNLHEYQTVVENFKMKKLTSFLEMIYLPSDKKHDSKEILDTLPLKHLINYISMRVRSKIGKKKA